MNAGSHGLLEQRLDRLEERGRAVLTAAARDAAWRRAIHVAARASVVVPALWLVVALFRPVPIPFAILSTILAPMALLALVFARLMARHRVARGEALALVDRSLALKDRSVIAAEFLSGDASDGFRQAALQEAAPWLDRAVSTPVAAVGGAKAAFRHGWAWPLAALAILALAVVLQPARQGGEGSGGRPYLAKVAAALGVGPSGSNALDREEGVADRQEAGTAGGAAAGTGARAGLAAGASAGRAGEPGMAGPTTGAAGPAGPPKTGGGSGPSPSSAAGGQDMAAGGRMDGGAQGEPSPRDARDGQRGLQKGEATNTASAAGETRATSPRGAQGGAAALSSPSASPPPGTPGGNQDPQGSGARHRQPSGDQSQGSGSSGRASNNGQQGSNRGSGQEGTKRARGSSSLLLAVPMQDRVIGTVNAGAVSSTTRTAPPRAMASGMVAAGGRGTGQGPAAQLPQRTRSAQEDRLLEAYFRRAGVGR